jgi:hypothetical protein
MIVLNATSQVSSSKCFILDNSYLHENIVKVGQDQYIAQGDIFGGGVLTLKDIKNALVQLGVDAGYVQDTKKARAAAAKEIYDGAVVELNINVTK